MAIEVKDVRHRKYQLEDNSLKGGKKRRRNFSASLYCEVQFTHAWWEGPDESGVDTKYYEWFPVHKDPNDPENHLLLMECQDRDIFNNGDLTDYRPIPEEVHFQIQLEILRLERNDDLKLTDYYGMSDVVMTEEMQTYRQELRDMTNGLTTSVQVKAVTWPTRPS